VQRCGISQSRGMGPWKFIRLTLATVCAALLLCGCSAFNYEWRQASKKSTPANSIDGRWEGRWLSHSNGHTGRLRCLVTPVETNRFDAKFHAVYSHSRFTWLSLRFSYTVRLHSTESVDGVTFRGEENLGPLAGGIYTYEGDATPARFFSTYRSKYDHGVFEMSRPAPPKADDFPRE